MEQREAMNSDDRQILRLAVPSDLPGGLDAARSGHFGRSPSFTIVDIVDDVVVNTFTVLNPPHQKGDHCLAQVLTLGENLVDVIIVAGIGRKPLLTCLQAGMRVFAGEDRPTVRSVVQAFVDAELVPVGQDATALH
jgi:predicted Fe-Mo cluster-binding NifX family protein